MASATKLTGVIGNRVTRRPAPLPRSQVIHRPSIETLTYSQVQWDNTTTVTVTSSLSGIVYYFWFLDGVYVATTITNHYTFSILADEQARVEVLASNDAGFDFVANAPSPSMPAARVTLWWIRSTDTDVKEYKIEQQKDAGGWGTIATVPFQAGGWDYRLLSPRLDDLASYEWRITPVDAAGNEGSTTTLEARTIVRVPDAPDFTATFDEGTTKITFAEAA